MQDQLAQTIHDKNKPTKTYIVYAFCPFPFDRSIDMPTFLRRLELPKFDKYFGTTNPQRSFVGIHGLVYGIYA